MVLIAILGLFVSMTAAQAQTPAERIVPREFALPALTEWRPSGCRDVPFEHPTLLPRTGFRRAHGDLDSSDEVDLAYAPVFARHWVAEPSLYQVTTPSFDGAGNIYMTPLLPHEPILVVSLDAETGARRFVVPLEPGQRGGGVVPLVLRDPDTGGDVVYINSYSRILAVRADDGSIVWDVETGLGAATTAAQSPIGLAWVPNADAIVGQTRDGFVFLYDRRTGATVVAPRQLPGEATPPLPSTIPAELAAEVDELLDPLVAFSSGGGILDLISVLLGGSSEIANNLSVDARNNRLWIAATARDGDDGSADGVSELGALYRFDVVAAGDGWDLVERCSRNFSGGSASTPTLSRDGARVYLGDDAGALIAIEADDCSDAWEVPLDSQIFGSVAVASDGKEIYAASAEGIFQLFDDGGRGRRGWTATLDLYDVPEDLANFEGMNLLLTGAGANGLLIQAGVGISTGTQRLPVRTGIAHVDRLTGEPRWFADGLEESLAAMSTGPDGALYLSHSPLRRAFAFALGLTGEPMLGGISKWAATRHDLLMRDATCAAADRGANAYDNADVCPDAAGADAAQMTELIAQTRAAAGPALDAAELTAAAWDHIDRWLGDAEVALASYRDGGSTADLEAAASQLADACALLVDPSSLPPAVDDEDDGCAVGPAREPAWPIVFALLALAAITKRASRRR